MWDELRCRDDLLYLEWGSARAGSPLGTGFSAARPQIYWWQHSFSYLIH